MHPSSLLCVGDILAVPLYLLLTITVLASIISPLLRDLSSHGKTRSRAYQRQQQTNESFISRWYRYVVESDVFLVDKRRFLHFYIVGIISTSTLWFLSGQYFADLLLQDNVPILLLLIHLCRRAYECKYIHAWGSGKMHIGGYILGLIHYIFIPFVFVGKDWCCTSSDQSTTEESAIIRPYSVARILLSFILCCYGQLQQYLHHHILANLRGTQKGSGKSKSSHYRIPKGRWFVYVSCPHYLAEILIYISFAITPRPLNGVTCDSETMVASVGHPIFGSAILFASKLRMYSHLVLLVWVATNLAVSANAGHGWYMRHFGTAYPRDRKAIIPFIF